ncbi:hypothetical protein BpHYR1_010202 [Brachionus plicatilis]|uniref:Uncharacterized protein n=1 Tax=Brachionus plicatilis TaxID=10195 RepID=A0A3M7R0E7_BRAPC|nr:hypothetical protein BpHYR1_010202 [Brachionus plicatilis]
MVVTRNLKSDDNIESLEVSFNKSLSPLLTWCIFNRLNINWSKTHVMFVHNKRVKTPKFATFNGHQIKAVSNCEGELLMINFSIFKLLKYRRFLIKRQKGRPLIINVY